MKTLINEINRQLQLMGVNKVITEGVIRNWGSNFLHDIIFSSGPVNRTTLVNLYDEAMKDMPGGIKLKNFEELEEDLNRVFTTGRSTRVTESEYNKLASKMLEKVGKETRFDKITDLVISQYRAWNGFNSTSPEGTLLDRLISAARKANTDRSELAVFNEIQQELVKLGVVDPSIIQIIKNKYFKAVIPNTVIQTMDGMIKAIKNMPGIKQIYDNFIKVSPNAIRMQAIFDEMESIFRQFDSDVFSGNNPNFDMASARLRLSQLAEEAAEGEKDLLYKLWKDLKEKIPGGVSKNLEDKNGVLNYNNFLEWKQYFENVSLDQNRKKPSEFIGRAEAFIKIFRNPSPEGDEATTRLSRNFLRGRRLLREYTRGSARLPIEIKQIEKSLGKKGARGYFIVERIYAYLFLYPLAGGLIQTFLDYLENTGTITNDGKGYNVGSVSFMEWSKDWTTLHGETWNTQGIRKGGNVVAFCQSFGINIVKFINPLSPSLQQVSAISPALAGAIQRFYSIKSGEVIYKEEVMKVKVTVVEEQKNMGQQLKTIGLENPELKKVMDTIEEMQPLNVTSEIINDTTKTK